jgi:hypothetical protein
MDVRSGGHGVNGPQDATARASLDALITLRVAELRVLAATTAVVWGRSPGRTFEQIAGEAHDGAKRFLCGMQVRTAR